MGFLSRLFGRRARVRPAGGTGGVDMSEMVRTLAALPEEERRTMIRSRLQRFAEQADAERAAGMRMMLIAALDLSTEDHRKVAASRMAVLMGFPEDQRMTLMKTHVSVLMDLPPEQQAKETGVMKELLMELPEEKRMVVMGMMEQLGMSM